MDCTERFIEDQANFRPAQIPYNQPPNYENTMSLINPPQSIGNLTAAEKQILKTTSILKKKSRVNMTVRDMTFIIIIVKKY